MRRELWIGAIFVSIIFWGLSDSVVCSAPVNPQEQIKRFSTAVQKKDLKKDDRVSSIANKLLGDLSRKWKIEVRVGDLEDWLGGSNPNGQIVINNKYIGISDDEMALLLGHEIGHVLLGHNRESDKKRFSQYSLFDQYYYTKFTREQEFAADEWGMKLLIRAGYNPSNALNLYRREAEKEGALIKIAGKISEDPTFSDRLKRLSGYLEKEQTDKPPISSIMPNVRRLSNDIFQVYLGADEETGVKFWRYSKDPKDPCSTLKSGEMDIIGEVPESISLSLLDDTLAWSLVKKGFKMAASSSCWEKMLHSRISLMVQYTPTTFSLPCVKANWTRKEGTWGEVEWQNYSHKVLAKTQQKLKDAQKEKVVEDKSSISASYYPLKEGMRWEYQTGGTSMLLLGGGKTVETTVTNLAPRELKGKKVIPQNIEAAGQIQFSFIVQEVSGIYEFATQSPGDVEPKINQPPVYLIKHPIEVGKGWENKEKHPLMGDLLLLSGQDPFIVVKYLIEGIDETVTVPAGTFNGCLKIKSVGSRKGEFAIEQYHWYAPGVGLVKYILKANGAAALTLDLVALKK